MIYMKCFFGSDRGSRKHRSRQQTGHALHTEDILSGSVQGHVALCNHHHLLCAEC